LLCFVLIFVLSCSLFCLYRPVAQAGGYAIVGVSCFSLSSFFFSYKLAAQARGFAVFCFYSTHLH
jgi:hypothetical protein